MLTKLISWLTAASLLVAVNPALAAPNSIRMLHTPGTTRILHVPQSADHSPVISLGTAIDPQTGEAVEGYMFIRYKQADAKGGHGGGSGSVCYAYLASGAKWKTVEPWIMNPANSDGLTNDFVLSTMTANTLKWKDATDGIIGNGIGTTILGTGSTTSDTLVADTVAPDGLNEIYFGTIDDPNTIAVTIVWGTFSGPPNGRKLIEWDQVFNTAYAWSASGESGKMDFEDIATHEMGHAVGLADLYNSSCNLETMYGYSNFGETLKRDLHQGDITGTDQLY